MEDLCLNLNLRQPLFQSLSAVCVCWFAFFLTNTFFLRISFDSLINLGIFPRPHFYEAQIQLHMDCHGSEYSANMKGKIEFSRLKDLSDTAMEVFVFPDRLFDSRHRVLTGDQI